MKSKKNKFRAYFKVKNLIEINIETTTNASNTSILNVT